MRTVNPPKSHALLLGSLLALSPAAIAPASLPAQDVEGTWEGRFRDGAEPYVRLHLSADRGRHGHHETTVSLSRAEEAAALRAAGDGFDVFSWDVRRDAGTLRFEGRVRDGRGVGMFTFVADPGFVDRMAEIGFPGLNVEDVYSAAVLGVGPSRARELRSMGYEVTLDELFSAAIFDVDRTFQEEMETAGFRDLALDDLVAFRVHGVDAAYVDEARSLGFGRLSADDVLAMKIHGVDPETLRTAEEMGLGRVDMDDLLSMRIHGVTRRFLQELDELGYAPADLDQALAFRIHGVTPDWIRELEDMGYDDLTGEDLVSLKIHGLEDVPRRRRLLR